jgi:hypothetical protein
VDLAVMRRVRVGGERAIELRAEMFSLLNTANFGAPASMHGAANFGTITTALDPRRAARGEVLVLTRTSEVGRRGGVRLLSVPQAGFLQPGVDGFCCPRPYRVVSIHERRDLRPAQLEAAFAYRLQGAFRIIEELEAEFFVRYQPANEHFDNPLRHGHLLSLHRQGKLRTGSSHELVNDHLRRISGGPWAVGLCCRTRALGRANGAS